MTKQKTKAKEEKKESQKTQEDQKVDITIAAIDKKFGKGSILPLSSQAHVKVDVISTGSIALDAATVIRGIPKGRITELFGVESSSKSTMALHIVANTQRMGGRAAFIDMEHALSPKYAQDIGVNIDTMYLSQPTYAEEALEIMEMLIESSVFDTIILDSVAALVPKVELDGEMIDQQMGLQARLMSKAMRKMTGSVRKANCAVIFINQIREKMVRFGSPEITPGGRALKFYASLRIYLSFSKKIQVGTDIVGINIRAKIIKNKLASPFKVCEFPLIFGKGISELDEIISLGLEYEILVKKGTWITYGETMLGQGRENAKNKLINDQELLKEISEKVKQNIVTAGT